MIIRNIQYLLLAAVLTACNYLDVLPPEQEQSEDAVKDLRSTRGFLQSCYNVTRDVIRAGAVESSADEYTVYSMWNYTPNLKMAYNLLVPSFQNDYLYDLRIWSESYKYIAQCNRFLDLVGQAKGVTSAKKREWSAEVRVLRAYGHFLVLRAYGPCPIYDRTFPGNESSANFPGRSHYDYVTDWIVSEIDDVMEDLPDWQEGEWWGHVSKAAAKAIKARALLYAASPLWNGHFPFPEWKNDNYETPGYGKELVSGKEDPAKWERALTACQEALDFAVEKAGRKLYDTEVSNPLYKTANVPLPYIPGLAESGLSEDEQKAFQEKVLALRYCTTSRESEGNRETIWGMAPYNGGSEDRYYLWNITALPFRAQKKTSGGYVETISQIAPLLYSVEHFYTINGKLPAYDPKFFKEGDWFKSAGLDRSDIINLNTLREPRFYATLAFDGGDYGIQVTENGKTVPLTINLKDRLKQGFDHSRVNDNLSTGYLTHKFINPEFTYGSNGEINAGGSRIKPRPLFRLAELYLNLAECEAVLGQTQNALDNLNAIRRRAGVPELTTADLQGGMTLMDWVRNERFVELWGEGHRYYDLRRWGVAKDYLKAGAREGLNCEIDNPDFDTFNHRTTLKRPYVWDDRMILMPILYKEVYRNPQLVQAPGY